MVRKVVVFAFVALCCAQGSQAMGDNNGWTLLHSAAAKGNVNYVCEKLEDALDSERKKTDIYGRTALHLAAQNGHARVVDKILEEACGEETMRDKNGKTPLQLAIEKNHYNVIKVFKKYDVEV